VSWLGRNTRQIEAEKARDFELSTMSHTATPEQLQSVVAPLTVGGGVAPLTVGHFGSHEADPAPYIPGEDRDPSCIARLSREIEALKAEREGLREAAKAARHELTTLHGIEVCDGAAPGERWAIDCRAVLDQLGEALGK
jgi:hypothetical protein